MGYQQINDKITLFYEEYGSGDEIILSAQVGFYKKGMQQRLAEMGYHVYCITLRGFHPSTFVEEDYGEGWYDVFADDVVAFADKLNFYSNCGHNIDTDLIEETCDEADRFIRIWKTNGKWYRTVEEN